MSAAANLRRPAAMLEPASFSPDLAAKPMIAVATKLDAVQDPEGIESLRRMAEERGLPFYAISSATGEGLDGLIRRMAGAVLAPTGE